MLPKALANGPASAQLTFSWKRLTVPSRVLKWILDDSSFFGWPVVVSFAESLQLWPELSGQLSDHHAYLYKSNPFLYTFAKQMQEPCAGEGSLTIRDCSIWECIIRILFLFLWNIFASKVLCSVSTGWIQDSHLFLKSSYQKRRNMRKALGQCAHHFRRFFLLINKASKHNP